MDGIINVFKPPKMTSHDVVAFLRTMLKTKKIGHTGTLDPDAVGVLPICIGKATKLVEYITEKNKKYRAQLVLGISTDTQDSSGRIISTSDAKIGLFELNNVLKSFMGNIEQVPPMFSAVKLNGKKLYELARKGEIIERQPRSITIKSITIIKFDQSSNTAILDIECSKGTYIRTLCNDIGDSLGCGGHMGFLIRLHSGNFHIDDSYTLNEIDELKGKGELINALIPIDYVFEGIPSAVIKQTSLKWIQNGAHIFKKDIKGHLDKSDLIKIYDENNKFLAIYKFLNENGIEKYIPEKIFM